MRRNTVILTVSILMTSVFSFSQQIAHTQFFPVVARTAGAGGTQWLSDVTVVNLTDAGVDCGLQFLPADHANLFDPTFPVRISLAAHETRLLADVLGSVFGYTEDIKGSLLLTVDSTLITTNPSGSLILATTRTFNTGSPDGTYGQTVPALSLSINPAETESYVTGARNDGEFRSNLGIVSMALFAEITVHYQIMDSTGNAILEGEKDLQPASMGQWSFSELGVGSVEGPLTVKLWMDPDDVFPDPCASQFPNMFIAYVSKVDGNPEGTGDAEFIYAAPLEPYSCER